MKKGEKLPHAALRNIDLFVLYELLQCKSANAYFTITKHWNRFWQSISMVNKIKPEKLQFIYAYMKWRYLLVTVEWVL